MSAKINNPASCEVRSVTRSINARRHNAAEIHRQLCETYGPTAISEGKVRGGRSNIYDEERGDRSSVRSDDLTQRVTAKARGNRRFTISDLCIEFPEVSKTTVTI